MDDRMKQVAVAARDAVRKKAASESHLILNAMKAYEGQLISGMVETLNTVLHAAAAQQKKGDKGEIAYISFSFLVAASIEICTLSLQDVLLIYVSV